MTEETTDDEIIAHMSRHFGPVEHQGIHEILPVTGISIHFIHPTSDQDSLIAFTNGMSNRPQNIPPGQDKYRYTEIMVRLPRDWPHGSDDWTDPNHFWPIEWLKSLAWFPHDNQTWLGGQFPIIATNDPPESLGPNTDLSCLLLLQEDGEAGTVRLSDGRSVVLYSLLPIYTEERDLEVREGILALFKRLDEESIPLEINPTRLNVAADRS